MEDAVDCLIDLNSPVPNNLRVSLVPPIPTYQKTIPACTDIRAPTLDDNNPFDLVVRLTQINEADKNDPFEVAFEQARGYQVTSNNILDGPKDSVQPTEIPIKECIKEPQESQPLDECFDKELCPTQDFNLDDIQPPEFLANSSFELSDNDSITINDTLHLSSMSDFKLSPGDTECSPFKAKLNRADNFLSGGSESPISSRGKSSVLLKTLPLTDFSFDPLTLSDKSSFEESPTKVLCQLKSEESVKTMVESRIQKCIAKALNNSNLQFRNSFLLEPGETSFVVNRTKPLSGTLRTSLSVPQNLHLLGGDEIDKKCEQSSIALASSPQKPYILEDLTIPVLDTKTEAAKCSLNFSLDTNPERRSTNSFGIQDQKMSQYREIIDAELLKADHNSAPAIEDHTDSKPKGHRRSLSCDFVHQPALPVKESSPPKLPPLPLSSDTIRDLSLCSKYSPPKPKEKSPGYTTSKVTKRPVLLPACPQPKLVLRKKVTAPSIVGPVTATGTFSGATKGPMKAVVPVRNMTRFAGGSPRPSAQSQNRRGSIASSRQSSLESPSYQKSKLCPLAASTPSNPTLQDKTGPVCAQPVITAPSPRRVISSAIPSPSRRVSVSSQNPKADTPTKRMSAGRSSNPRVLIDKNGLGTSPSLTPAHKSHTRTEAHNPAPISKLGKENMACL